MEKEAKGLGEAEILEVPEKTDTQKLEEMFLENQHLQQRVMVQDQLITLVKENVEKLVGWQSVVTPDILEMEKKNREIVDEERAMYYYKLKAEVETRIKNAIANKWPKLQAAHNLVLKTITEIGPNNTWNRKAEFDHYFQKQIKPEKKEKPEEDAQKLKKPGKVLAP